MDKKQFIDRLVSSYRIYYDVKTENIEEPFFCEADFCSHEKQYMLIKAAEFGESLSYEYVYFAQVDELTEEKVMELDSIAWEKGLSRVEPRPNHRNSDITLYIIADSINREAIKAIEGIKHYKSYRHTFWGWSHYKLIAIEPTTGDVYYNRKGKSQQKFIYNILKK